MSRALYIAAKAPRPGFVKTRLARVLGEEPATRLYVAFLADLAARFARAPFPVGWYVTPDDAWEELAPLVGGLGDGARVLPQGGGDWAERQARLFEGAAERGEERTVLVGSDSPQLSVETVERAFSELNRRLLIFGPTLDGGYYLVGMRGYRDVLRGAPMSTGGVLDEILGRARAIGAPVTLLEPEFDVDTVEDLGRLREAAGRRPDMARTHAALARIDSTSRSRPDGPPHGDGRKG